MADEQYSISENRLKELMEMISNIAALRFGSKLDTGRNESPDEIIAAGLNVLAEELEHSIISRKELELSESRYSKLFNRMNDGLILTNRFNEIVETNPALSFLTGFKKSELMGQNAQLLFSSIEVHQLIQDAFETNKYEKSFSVITKIQQKNKDLIDVDIKLHPNFNDQGKFDGFLCIVSDISERIKAESEKERAIELLKQNKEKLNQEHQTVLHQQSMLLSTQLNPQFIFNALNAFQYFILEEKIEDSLRYISQLSRMARIIFERRDTVYVKLQVEIELISTFLEIERSRYNKRLKSTINITPELEKSDALVPSMFLLTYVEYAISQGVSQLKEGGEVTIEIKKKNKNQISCKIQFAGKGIKFANVLEMLKSGKKKSELMSIVQDRIRILDKIDDGSPYKVDFEDFMTGGQISGTIISILFPLHFEN